ncbi:MAG: co-chaperone GroES [Euryarchaeota archaeon]|jgi:chaperonin GroES
MLRPIHANIIIKQNDPDEVTSGGIILTNAKNDGVVEAEVLAVGEGTYDNKGKFTKPNVSPGDRILVNANGGTKFTHEDEEYISVTNNEIVAVFS